MGLDIAIWCAVAWMLVMMFQITAYTWMATIWYKVMPVVISVALVVLWAMEHGYIINPGAT